VSALGRTTSLIVVGILVGYIGLKYLRRWLFLRRLRIARISPTALKQKLDDGEDPLIVDLRTPLDVATTPFAIPGSRWITVEALDERLVGDSAGSRADPLLLLTERSDERPGGAPAQASRDHPGPAAPRGPRRLDHHGLSRS
jgi:hypothetical protein